MKLSAVIFDLNGTVVIDDHVWDDAYGGVLESLGLAREKGKSHICGVSVDDNWRILINKFRVESGKSPQELSAMTNREYLKNLGKIKVRQGFEELAQNFVDSGLPLGLATSSHWHIVDETFRETGIGGYFDFVTTGEEVVSGKPSPDIFDIAGEKIGVDPEECLVFEDSESGVEAAKAAGMKVIGIYRDSRHKKTLEDADALVAGFEKVTPEMIDSI
jgi:beta-phosphoglucomutase